LVWFRLDLRWEDQPALLAAAQRGQPVIPVFIWAPEEEGAWPPGGASRWWLHQSLKALAAGLHRLGGRLILRRGPTLTALEALLHETGASAVYWNRRYEPALVARDKMIKETLRARGVEAQSWNAALLFEPWTIKNQSGAPFQVFTPFWKHCLRQPAPPLPLPAPSTLPAPARWPDSLPLEALELEPKVDWTAGLRAAWQARRALPANSSVSWPPASASILSSATCQPLPALRDSRHICTSAKSVPVKFGMD
jgi:deoxyribodipyrimidine photo-lyase